MNNQPAEDVLAAEMRRSLWARWEALHAAEKIRDKRDEYLEGKARVLMEAGLTLIPSDVLRDNEFVVSQDVYDAAKRLSGVK